MDNTALEKLRYPTGKFVVPEKYTDETRKASISALSSLPSQLAEVTAAMTDEQLDQPYREGAWCSRQIIHHLADSHMNSFIRFKLALTEDNPKIKAYDQDSWAKGIDHKLPIKYSLDILSGVHARLVNLMENMSSEDFGKTLYHPEYDKNLSLDFMGALYGWHSKHHLTQIVELKERQGW